MSQKALNRLPAETVKLISSTQIITSVSAAVKELVENSIDANARNIQVRLDNYGFDVLEVKDDGHGISYDNVNRMFLSGYTSKISCFDDLGKLNSYGFRGEALSAIVKLGKVTITTKTTADTLGMTYTINSEGIPESSKAHHLVKGTILKVANLFANLPVRKQYLSSKRKASEELKKVEQVVQSLAIIHPELRLALCHNGCPIWQKNPVKCLRQSFMQAVGLKVTSRMEHLNELSNNVLVDLIIPKKDLENIDNIFTSSRHHVYIYINRRPLTVNKISKVVMEHVFLHFGNLNPTGKYAICLISVEVIPQEIDVNLEPNKTKVLLKNEDDVISILDRMLSGYYKHTIIREKPDSEETGAVQDIENEDEEEKTGGEENERIDDNSSQQRKRPRLAKDPPEYVASVRDKEFLEKNDGWHLQVMSSDHEGEELLSQNTQKSNLCSQINKDNCVLTTPEEESDLAALLRQKSHALVTSLKSDTESADRNDIQSYGAMKANIDRVEPEKEVVRDKPILPEWPERRVNVIPEEEEFLSKGDIDAEVDLPNSAGERDESKTENIPDNFDAWNWSRGTVGGEKDKVPNGVILARLGAIDENDSDVLKEDVEQFDLSMQSVSSQMGKKELSAFTKFARVMRPTILKEFPGIMFTKVATLLVERWHALSTDERKYYEKLAVVVDAERKAHQESKSENNQKIDTVLQSKRKTDADWKKPERYELEVTISLRDITERRNVTWTDPAGDEMQPLGQLQPSGNWLYRKGSEIGHVRHAGLQELILSQKMLSSMNVPRQQAENAIPIDEITLGKELWDTLIGMEKQYDPVGCRYTVVSDVITKNGFNIELEKSQDTIGRGWITEVASFIPYYGIAELKQTLRLVRSKGTVADLKDVRTTPVINYITNEAIRIVQQMPRPPDLRELKEWIDTWRIGLTHLPPKCLHRKDIFVPMFQVQTGG